MVTHTVASLKDAKLVKAASEDILDRIEDEDIQDCIDSEEAVMHDGDLALDGELSLYDQGVLIVNGDLTVSESVMTDETATLIVTGNLKCRHLYLEGNLEIQGDANVRGVIYGFYEAGM